MLARVTEDKRFLQFVEYTNEEIEQVQLSFKKRIANWRFHPLCKKKIWDGFISFVDKYQRMPFGLWNELNFVCQDFKIQLEIEGIKENLNIDIDVQKFRNWVEDFFKSNDIKPRDYQIDACIEMLKYKKSISEIATSAGKTLIIFMVFSYLKEVLGAKKMLIIVPNTNLILQTLEDFESYNKGKIEYKTQLVHGLTDKAKKDVDLVIGTYQSLVKSTPDFFEDFDMICVDEAHHTQANSIKKILSNCINSVYTIGMSGTMLQNGSAEALTIQAYIGPLVNNISATYLTDNKYATPINVKIIQLDYLDEKTRVKLQELRYRRNEIEGRKILDLERKILVENRPRFLYVCNFIAKSTKNTLVLFQNVKDDYGRKIADWLRENAIEKEIYYVDGNTSINNREFYINDMEIGKNKILVASFGTFSTGISIHNIHNIFFVESYKSEKIIRQSIGRGMRLMGGKEQVNVVDFVDDYSVQSSNSKNYLLRHGYERLKIYKEQGFPFKKYKVEI